MKLVVVLISFFSLNLFASVELSTRASVGVKENSDELRDAKKAYLKENRAMWSAYNDVRACYKKLISQTPANKRGPVRSQIAMLGKEQARWQRGLRRLCQRRFAKTEALYYQCLELANNRQKRELKSELNVCNRKLK